MKKITKKQKIIIITILIVSIFGAAISFADTISEQTLTDSILSLPSQEEQIEVLYEVIGKEVGLEARYVKSLHAIGGGKAIYSSKTADIYNEYTVESLKPPVYFEDKEITYKKAEFIKSVDTLKRPYEYYLPDALYSVAVEVKSIMNERYKYDRGTYQSYFDLLSEETKRDITFYEAVLLYTGTDLETVDNLYMAYEQILSIKESDENVVEYGMFGYKFKSKFSQIFKDIGLKDKKSLEYLAIMFTFDKNLAKNDSIEMLQTKYEVPYEINYTSRENMMVAAASLCGKVRYVWGGGHSGASYIDGINPIWIRFENLYPETKESEVENEDGTLETVKNEGFGTCIKPSGSWCPIHGSTSAEYHGGNVKSLEEYIEMSAERLDAAELRDDKYQEMLSKVDYEKGINIHTLDGLDCSGFASWLYNQLTDEFEVNSTAINFLNQKAFKEIPLDSELLPGDLFTWTSHIVIIVGKVSESNKVYVTIEQTPNVLRYGVLYHSGASKDEIEQGKQIAAEANLLIGGLDPELEAPHCYNMDAVGKYTVENTVTEEVEVTEEVLKYEYAADNDEDLNDDDLEEGQWYDYSEEDGCYYKYWYEEETHTEEQEKIVEEEKQFNVAGRFELEFVDEDEILEGFDMPLKDLTAVDIIQHTITKLPISYTSGYHVYNGELFDKSQIASNIGIQD